MSGPIFVVGTMRSGSTLLRLILDSHENIAMSEETGFMGALATTKAIPNWRYGREWYGRLGWTEQELDERLRDFYAGMFERHALREGKKRWGDKTPFHSTHMQDMARIFPDAVFLAIVRHPGAVVASLRKKFHYEVAEAASYWTATNAEVLRRGEDLGDERFALLRYEDLVTNAEPTLRGMTSWLREPWSDGLLRHQEVQTAKGAPRLVDGSTSTRAPIDPQRASAWRSGMSDAEVQTLAEHTGELARFLGYDAVLAERLDDLSAQPPAEHHPVLTGRDIAERRRGWTPPLRYPAAPGNVVVADMSAEDLARRVAQAEASLARIRARPVVRMADSVRRMQRRLSLPTLAELRTSLGRLTGRRG
jgi:hypothetical protein